ncbi:MAG: HTTM domain-containing protein, partial [Saprospiraceae bacterium]|nr:HTTM domain-containing protein [Saprospiraceae bacterium]
MTDRVSTYLKVKSKAAPLAVFRILFGSLMLVSIVRFYCNGWIEKLYLQPSFHFKYRFFEWVVVPDGWTYLLFVGCGLAALGVALGLFYRLSITLFFVLFTYIELMDKTTYLNHYYFVSVVSFLL